MGPKKPDIWLKTCNQCLANTFVTVKPLPTKCTLGDIRLVNGSSKHEGRVEVCFGNLWGTICHNSWDNRDAGVICKQLFNSSYGELFIATVFT